jgi:poly(ADP-ribose) glycohydrolase ARH3
VCVKTTLLLRPGQAPLADRFSGCLLGLASGDALGAPHEGGVLERWIWRLIGRTREGAMRWTDDTQMALDLADSLLAEGALRPDALAQQFASGYRWSRGYGPGARRVLKLIRRGTPWQRASRVAHAEGSFGNGAAMRAPVLALFWPSDRTALLAAARESAIVTHAHPLGVQGAVMIALAAQSLLAGADPLNVIDLVQVHCLLPAFAERLRTVRTWIAAGQPVAPREVVKHLGHRMLAPDSCPTALYLALSHLDAPFQALLDAAIAVGGDVDTIAAMAGALWGCVNGVAGLPDFPLEQRGRLVATADRLFIRAVGHAPK